MGPTCEARTCHAAAPPPCLTSCRRSLPLDGVSPEGPRCRGGLVVWGGGNKVMYTVLTAGLLCRNCRKCRGFHAPCVFFLHAVKRPCACVPKKCLCAQLSEATPRTMLYHSLGTTPVRADVSPDNFKYFFVEKQFPGLKKFVNVVIFWLQTSKKSAFPNPFLPSDLS